MDRKIAFLFELSHLAESPFSINFKTTSHVCATILLSLSKKQKT